MKVYLPTSFFTEGIVNSIKETGARVIRAEQPKEISPGVWLTGTMGERIKEQSLIIDTPKGIVVICGCSHPGIIDIIKRAKDITRENVHLVMGGFHLNNKSVKEVKTIVDEFQHLGVAHAGPSHCTGENAIELFKQRYGKRFERLGVGRTITLELDRNN